MTISPRWCAALCLLAASALAAPPAWAQDEGGATPSSRHAAALAAGFRALHYCTGLFSSGMSRETLDFTSRTRTRTDATLRMEVDEKAKTVAVHFLPDMEPRIAVWRPHLGCTQLPIGAKHVCRGAAAAHPHDRHCADARRASMADGRRERHGHAGARTGVPRSRRYWTTRSSIRPARTAATRGA